MAVIKNFLTGSVVVGAFILPIIALSMIWEWLPFVVILGGSFLVLTYVMGKTIRDYNNGH